jgi:transcriptional regulator with XRE-family HTH domain
MPFPTQVQRNELAQAIWGLRTSIGMKQQELAARLGISTTTMGRLEKNSEPTWPVLDGLAKIAREQNLPLLAEVFERELSKRREQLTHDIGKFLNSGLAKQIPVEEFRRMAYLIFQIHDDWESIETAIKPESYEGFARERLQELKTDIDRNFKELIDLIYPYGGTQHDIEMEQPRRAT